LKKIIQILFFLAILFLSTSVIAENNNVLLYESLGIIEKGEHELDKNVTRGEFAIWLSNITGENCTGVQYFTDVPEGSSVYNAILNLHSMGIIKGSNNKFLPDENILCSDAMVMIIRLLGYDDRAELSGGYPEGYYKLAAELGLSAGIKYDSYLTFSEGLKLLDKLLDTPCFVINEIKDNAYSMSDSDNIKPLEYYRDIKEGKGVIEANDLSGIYSKAAAPSNCVIIDGKTYSEGDTNAGEYIGYKVRYYYEAKEDNEDYDRLLYIDIQRYNEVTEIIVDDGVHFDDNILYYTVGNKEKNKKIPVDAKIISNGMAAGTYINPDNFVPLDGRINLIDNDIDGTIDIVVMERYENLVVLGVSEERSLVTGKYSGILDLSDKRSGTDYIITDDYDNEISIGLLREWDVLSIMRSPDGSFMNIFVCEDNVEGVIESISEDEIYINGECYKFAGSFINSGAKVKAGDKVTLYFDKSGFIAGVKKAESADNYAFMSKAFYEIKEGLVIWLLEPNSNGTPKKYECAEKVNVNGRSYNNEEAYHILLDRDMYDFESDGSKVLRQVIRYEFDDTGRIRRIVTPKDYATDDLYCSHREKGRTIKTTSNGYEYAVANRAMVVSDDVVIFIVPQDSEAENESSLYAVKGREYMLSKINSNDITETYHTTNNNLACDYVVFYVSNSDNYIANDSAAYIVDRWEKALNDENEVVQKLYMYNKNGEVIRYAADDYNLDEVLADDGVTKLSEGDIIRIVEDAAGRVTYIQICYNYKNNKCYKQGEFVTTSTFAYRTDIPANALMSAVFDINAAKPTLESTESMSLDRFTVYYYDATKKKNKVRIGKIEDIMPFYSFGSAASGIVINRQSGDARSMVIYNEDRDD